MMIRGLVSLALVLAAISCKDTKDTPVPTTTAKDTIPDPALVSNSIVYNHALYRAKLGAHGTIIQYFTSVNEFALIDSGVVKNVKLEIVLPNSNPPTGKYRLRTYGYADAYPGAGNVQLGLGVGNKIYTSKDEPNVYVDIVNLTDSIEVSFKGIKLYDDMPGALSAKIKIATKPVEPVYVGKATFTNGSADTLAYMANNDIHTFIFGSKDWKDKSVLFIDFKEFPTKTKTYKIVSNLSEADDEVSFSVLSKDGSQYGPSPLSAQGKPFYVTKEANGDLSFHFEDIPSPGLDVPLSGSGIISSFVPKAQE